MLIFEYQEQWKTDFESIKEALSQQFHSLKVTIEHVGSTSVESMPAKPIIDIDIVYEFADFEEIKIRLEEIDYYHNGNQGIEDREVFKRNEGVHHPIFDTIKHHLYVCHYQSRELKRHLLFRDYLRTNQDARAQYAKLKRELAKKAFQDKNIYALLKEQNANDFINECIKKQETKNGK